MIVHVTEDHIAKGQRVNAFLCPVALALCDATGIKDWTVLEHEAKLTDAKFNGHKRFFFTRPVVDAIELYDQFGEMEPFDFTILGEFESAPESESDEGYLAYPDTTE